MRCRGNTVLCVLDGTLWGELGLGWLGCKPQSAEEIDRMLQNRRHRPFPPLAVLCSGARLGLLAGSSISLRGLELRAVSKHGVHDDGKPACQGDARLAHGGAPTNAERPLLERQIATIA